MIAYPSLRIKMPTNAISIATPTQSTRVLDFTHITWNAGAGPLEFQPSYNSATGTSTAVQNLYTLTGPTTWAFVQVGPDRQADDLAPADRLRLPLLRLHALHRPAPAAASVHRSPPARRSTSAWRATRSSVACPTRPPRAHRPRRNCTNPNGLYGLSVGWGDEYSFPDTGNNIDISNLPDGTYWLRAQADPFGYFAQQGPDQSVTDTQLQITGTTVKVLQQVTPAISRPVVTITSPTDGGVVSGATTLQAIGGRLGHRHQRAVHRRRRAVRRAHHHRRPDLLAAPCRACRPVST